MRTSETPDLPTAYAASPAVDGTVQLGPRSFDALMPPEIAARAVEVGTAKSRADAFGTLALALLAGAFIGLGAAFATTVGAGAAEALPFGVTRLLVGFVFSLGLVLVVVAGAELFTGNNLIVMAWAERRVSLRNLLRNWGSSTPATLSALSLLLRSSSPRASTSSAAARSGRAHSP